MIYQHTARIYNKNRLRLLYIQNNRLLADRLGIHQIKKITYQHSGPILTPKKTLEVLKKFWDSESKKRSLLLIFFQITNTSTHFMNVVFIKHFISHSISSVIIATFFYFSWHVQSRTEMRHTHPLRNYSYIFRNWKKEATTKTPIVIRIKNDLV